MLSLAGGIGPGREKANLCRSGWTCRGRTGLAGFPGKGRSPGPPTNSSIPSPAVAIVPFSHREPVWGSVSSSGEAAAAPAAPAARPRSPEPEPASSARRSRPAEQADGKSQFLPHINKVGTGRTALGAEREGKGVGSLLHGPLPAQPRLLPRELPPPAGARRTALRGGGWARGLRPARGRHRRWQTASAGGPGSGGCPGRAPERQRGAVSARFARPRSAAAPRAARQLSPTRALARWHAESHGHAAARSPCHAHAAAPPSCPVTLTSRVTRAFIPTRTRCPPSHRILGGSTAALTHSLPPPAGTHAEHLSRCPSHTLRVTRPLTLALPRTRGRTSAGFPTRAHAARSRSPRTSSRRHSPPSIPHTRSRPRAAPRARHPRTHTRDPPRSRPRGAVPAPRPGGRVCALAGNPRTFPAASLAALRRHRRASCAAPVRSSLCLFPPDGRAGGRREGQQVPLPAVPPALGCLHLPPGIPSSGKPPLLSKLRCRAFCPRPPLSVPG